MGKRIPVVLVAGFLGAGKTTLLNHLLRHADGTRIAVVVNDFGSVNIDAMLVSAQVDSMVSLGNGCLCCVLDTSDLDGMFSRLARTKPDVIVVEASGLAEPVELVQMVLASRHQRIRYAGLLMVVDGAHFAATRAEHPEIDRHLHYADLVVANKDDLLDPAERAALHATLAELAPGAPVVPSLRGRIDPALLFDAAPHGARTVPRARQLSFDDLLRDAATHEAHGDHGTDAADDAHADHLHSAYDTLNLESAEPLDPRAFAAFMERGFPGVYRMKGFVRFALPGRPDRYTLQLVGRHLSYTRSGWPRGQQPTTTLVAIGAGFDAAALRDGFAACTLAESAGPVADPDIAMAGIRRHLEGREAEDRAAARESDTPGTDPDLSAAEVEAYAD
ncbi:GTP-binding protein [Yinghuangia aomiensis]|uniref:GTP-binding protein n=1 Tax=Yinghuangia aomiensis TaxID=676205 RepID=A0ABP9HVQ4_9ACTN